MAVDEPFIHTSQLTSWREFTDVVTGGDLLSFGRQVIWRGQSSAEWALETSFDRAVRKSGMEPTAALAYRHLQSFKRAARGRRTVPVGSQLSEDEWWSLGQHYGLVTPLLDWTYAPYVALYFAFLDPSSSSAEGNRAVWAFNTSMLDRLKENALQGVPHPSAAEMFNLLDPLVDENARLVNQNGVFTRGPVGQTMDAWVLTADIGALSPLWKLVIPDKDREDCLRHLNQMNINHVSLFPDLDGASRHCNNQITIRNY